VLRPFKANDYGNSALMLGAYRLRHSTGTRRGIRI